MTSGVSGIPPRVVLLGGGGHAAVCADVLEQNGWEVLGYSAPAVERDSEMAWLGNDDELFGLWEMPRPALFPAIGDNLLRRRLVERAHAQGWHIPSAVSRWAMIARTASIGAGAVVMPGAVLNAHAHLGTGSIVNSGAIVEHHVRVGPFAHIAPNATLAGRVQVGEASFVGAGAVVIPEVVIGERVIVGAGATVVRNVPDGVVVVGTPARTVRTIGE